MSDLAWAILTLGFLASCFIGALLLALHDYGQQRARHKQGSDRNLS